MAPLEEKIESLVRELPDPEGARLFYERVVAEQPHVTRLFGRDAGLLADALALAAWSPLLATTLVQNPDHLQWLARERTLSRVRTTEELGESLARFALTHSQLDPSVRLARFRRRELLRVYLRDVRRVSTIVETTEELSNLADAVLRYALGLARQELENLYGAPQCEDERGRKKAAGFCVVALGKLGSRELNYSSDIDLLFLYSDDGVTSETGARGHVTNREFFCKLAERVARLVGNPTGEGAVYRVDLRLRPHGRDGALACSLAEALRYYTEAAHAWELQALIRSRASAGSQALFARFSEGLRARVYRPDLTVAQALADVRLAKQKIDRQHRADVGGFNIKLGRGGIREIEFIAQALQLAYGGRDAWLHAPHTLISLGRLADRALINERERTELSDAYAFLRTLEHRLQMEHGLQTHTVADDPARRRLVARRMHFQEPDALAAFERALAAHTARVSAAYARVFGVGQEAGEQNATGEPSRPAPSEPSRSAPDETPAPAFTLREPPAEAEAAAALMAASVFAHYGATRATTADEIAALADTLREEARASLNARRALALTARVAASLDKSDARLEVSAEDLRALVRLCGASEFFGEMIAGAPSLIPAARTPAEEVRERDRRALLRAAVDRERSFGAELTALRRTWSRLLVEIGACDAAGTISVAESNQLQTELAAASINVALLVARRELARRFGSFRAGPRLAVLGLGRLGSGGTDYGSDLDLVLVYDAHVPPPLAGLSREEAYARLCELMTAALSSLTRDGHLYRVDLRLRPDGKNGPVALGSQAFVNYLRERAQVWEWLAYVKLRAVAGDLELGRAVERESRRAVHDAARGAGGEGLRAETRRVRERLERERAPRRGRHATDIKFAAGGMLDVYFAARYLQLRDGVHEDAEDRSTRATLARLRAAGSLAGEDFEALDGGYALLREVDHQRRLLAGRSTPLPSAEDHPLLQDIARRAGFANAAALKQELTARMAAVRAAYDRITGEKD